MKLAVSLYIFQRFRHFRVVKCKGLRTTLDGCNDLCSCSNERPLFLRSSSLRSGQGPRSQLKGTARAELQSCFQQLTMLEQNKIMARKVHVCAYSAALPRLSHSVPRPSDPLWPEVSPHTNVQSGHFGLDSRPGACECSMKSSTKPISARQGTMNSLQPFRARRNSLREVRSTVHCTRIMPFRARMVGRSLPKLITRSGIVCGALKSAY